MVWVRLESIAQGRVLLVGEEMRLEAGQTCMLGGSNYTLTDPQNLCLEAAQEAPNVNKAVVVFTDGEDPNGGKTIANIVQEAKSQGVKVFTVGLGQADTAVLSQMALPTGG